MKAHETILDPLLNGTKQYVVPLFQRPYTWSRKNWEMLWEDLKELIDNGPDRAHFLGSVVTIPTHSVPEGVAKFLLIDGQQRLTTILVLLAAIRDQAKKEAATEKLAKQIDELVLHNHLQDGNECFKLLPTAADRPAFLALMEGDTSQKGRVTDAYRFFARKLATVDDSAQLRDAILKRFQVVIVVLDRDDNPYVIFEGLNNKGEPLSQADLIRNYFFMRIHVREHDALHAKYWKPMEDALGERMTEFFWHFLQKDGADVRYREVFATLRKRGDELALNSLDSFFEELKSYSVHYAKLLDPSREPNLEIRKRLERLSRIEVTVSYPFLLKVYDQVAKGALPSESFIDVLDVVENFVLRRFVAGVPTNQLRKIFLGAYAAASNHGDFVTGLKQTLKNKGYPRDDEFKERLISTRLYIGDRVPKLRVILERLEESFGHKEKVDLKTLSIEHVMPQTLTDWWEKHLGENWEDIHEQWLHTLGNLTLTGYNSPLGNEPFPDKKVIYAESNLALNRWFEGCTQWGEEQIKARASEVAERALKIWPSFAGKDEPSQVPLPVTGTTPASVTVWGVTEPTESWREVLEKTLNVFGEDNPDAFATAAASFHRFIRKSSDGMRRPRKLADGRFVEANVSAATVYWLCREVAEHMGYPPDAWSVGLKETGQQTIVQGTELPPVFNTLPMLVLRAVG